MCVRETPGTVCVGDAQSCIVYLAQVIRGQVLDTKWEHDTDLGKPSGFRLHFLIGTDAVRN